jgi:NADH-quinone oxidoreductase subunit M
MAPLLVGIVFMGVYPKPVIERMEPAVDALIAHVEFHVEDFEEPTADIIAPVEGDHGGDGEGEEEGDH